MLSTANRIIGIRGPAGSGKTETAKDWFLSVGIKPTIISCSDQMTVEQLQG